MRDDIEYIRGLLSMLGETLSPPPLPTRKSPIIDNIPPPIPPHYDRDESLSDSETHSISELSSDSFQDTSPEYLNLLRRMLNENAPVKSKSSRPLHVEKNFLKVRLQSHLNGINKIQDLNEIIEKSNEIIVVSKRLIQINESIKKQNKVKIKTKHNKV